MDPERLGPECSPFEAEILRAGRGDAMSDKSGRAILAALGVASPVAASSAVAVGSKLALVKGLFIVAGIGAAGGLAFWGVQDTALAPHPAPALAPPAAVAAPAKARPAIEAINVGELPAAEPEAAAPAEAGQGQQPLDQQRAAVPSSAKVDTLPLELAAIDSARKALAQGNAALASRLLDRYSARFPKPRLGAEATVLRIETSIARGDRAGASRLGKAFLANNSKSPYARRVRSLIGDTASDSASGAQ